MRACFWVGLVLICSSARGEESVSAPAVIIDEYVTASQAQQSRLEGASMEVEIAAEVPKLHKTGRLHALRRISSIGRITYDLLGFEGDNTVKKEVIARYLTAEAEALKSGPAAFAVTPENYKFKYKGLTEKEGRQAHAFHITPRKKRVGLFNGELWVDAETHLSIREAGRFVKSPSIFIKKVEFVRDYRIQDGVAIPLHVETSVDTRLVGKAKLSVAYTSVSLPHRAEIALAGGGL